MKKILPVIVGLILICVFSSVYANVKKAHPIYDNDVDTGVYQSLGWMQEAVPVNQRFVCVEDVLDGFYLKTDVSGDCENIKLELTVVDVESEKVLSKNELSVSDLKSRKLNYFKTDRIEGYNGKLLELSVVQKGTEEGSAIGLYIQPQEGEGGAYVNGQPSGGVLVMKHVAERFDVESFLVAGFFCCFVWAFLWFLYRLFR